MTQFREFQLKNPQSYDQDLKTKILFIGQNGLALSKEDEPQQASLRQQILTDKRKNLALKSKHLSKNTFKQLS